MKSKNLRILTQAVSNWTKDTMVEIVSETKGWIKVHVAGDVENLTEFSVRAGWLRELTEREDTDRLTEKTRSRAKQVVEEALPIAGDGEVARAVDADLAHYTRHKVKTPCGRGALDIDDEAAKVLRGQDIDDCYFIVAKHIAQTVATATKEKNSEAIDVLIVDAEKDLKDKYSHLNLGMQRMNLGNRLRKLMGIYGNINAHKNAKKSAHAGA